MKKNLKKALFASVIFCAVFPAAAAVESDALRHTVSFTAVETDCGADAAVEFLFISPGSDRAYEALFVTDDKVSEIAAAFDRAGIPRGAPIDESEARFWPVGEKIEMTPSLAELVADRDKPGEPLGILYTGGERDMSGAPVAETNMPSAVFALYGDGQSLLQLDGNFGQSESYGRFTPVRKPVKGTRRKFTFAWGGRKTCEKFRLELSPGKSSAAFGDLKRKALEHPLDVTVCISRDTSFGDAVKYAHALEKIDSRRIKINSCEPGQFYYRAFLPLEKWRERQNRLSQPPEVRFLSDGGVEITEITEDWSDETKIEPALGVKTGKFASPEAAAATLSRLAERTSTALVFASPAVKMGRFYDFKAKIQAKISIWYFFTEN